jgi:hypothetical protein
MTTYIRNAIYKTKLWIHWTRVRKSHMHRRFDQLRMVIISANSMDALHHYAGMAIEFERRYGNDLVGGKLVARLCRLLDLRTRHLYHKLINYT